MPRLIIAGATMLTSTIWRFLLHVNLSNNTQAGVVNQHVTVEIARVQLPHQDVNRFRSG